MKIINVEQGSPEWHAWRKTVITATDCPAIRGSSPWSTAYKCWQKKLDLVAEQEKNSSMERGTALEPVIRNRFIEKYGINMTAVVGESEEYPFLGASFDGLSDCGKYILEVKTGGYKLHDMAKNGIIPPYYMDQVQQQLLVSGAEKCFYQVGNETHNEEFIEVYPDKDFVKAYIPVAREFWRCVAFSEPPELQDSDYKDMSDNETWKDLAARYQNICAYIKTLEESKEGYRKSLIELCGDHNCSGEGIRAMKTTTRGRVDYDSIPELKTVNLDDYRKKATTSWKVYVA